MVQDLFDIRGTKLVDIIINTLSKIPILVEFTSSLPLSKGLGSSAAFLVALTSVIYVNLLFFFQDILIYSIFFNAYLILTTE